jgi:predicted anti-sigma-YlaC factor YlaD
MRITTHGNDLLVTDQSLGLGAFLIALGVILLAAALGRLVDGALVSAATVFYTLSGLMALKVGFDKLIATQLIVDRDRELVIAKRWAVTGTQVQRIPFEAVSGFAIEPEGRDARTELFIHTSRGPVLVSGGTKGVRQAWEEVVDAVESHMGRRSGASESTE